MLAERLEAFQQIAKTQLDRLDDNDRRWPGEEEDDDDDQQMQVIMTRTRLGLALTSGGRTGRGASQQVASLHEFFLSDKFRELIMNFVASSLVNSNLRSVFTLCL